MKKDIALIISPTRYSHPILYLKERYGQILAKLGFNLTKSFEFIDKKKCLPLSLICLAEYLKRRTNYFKISILDGELISLKEIKDSLNLIRPAFVGISPTWASYESALEIARFSKKFDSKVILGGFYAAPLAQEVLLNHGPGSKDYCIDAVCRQDGEQCFADYVLGRPLGKIPNLVYRTGLEIKYNRLKFLKLDSLSWQDLSYINIKDYYYANYQGPGVKEITVFSRKGCGKRMRRGGCYFCSLEGSAVRYKSPLRFFKEIDYLVKKYSPQTIFDISDDFVDNPVWLSEFHRFYRKYPTKPEFKVYALFEKINSSTVKKLVEINVKSIILGVESGDDLVLSKIKKKYSAKKIKNIVKALSSQGIKIDITLILGLKGESHRSLKNTLKLVESLSNFSEVEFYPQLFKLLPGTQAFYELNQMMGSNRRYQDLYEQCEAFENWLSFFTKVTPYETLVAFKDIISTGKCPAYWFVKNSKTWRTIRSKISK